MTLDPACGVCYRDYDLHIFRHNKSDTLICLCVSCASHEMMRAGKEYTYQGSYVSVVERVADSYLSQYDGGLSGPYDQAMEEYLEAEGKTAQQLHDEAADALELDAWYNMPSDAVLDKYIDANPDKFDYVAYGDNTEDTQLAGLRQWHDLRQSAIGG